MYLQELEKTINKEAHALIDYLGKDGRYATRFDVYIEDMEDDSMALSWVEDNLYLTSNEDAILYDELDIQGKLLVAYYLDGFISEFNDYLHEETSKHTGCS
jgi:hypothetical protein